MSAPLPQLPTQQKKNQDKGGLHEFLRLRREDWKVRLGLSRVHLRLKLSTFSSWKTFKDYEVKLTPAQLKFASDSLLLAAKKKEKEKEKVLLIGAPKVYTGKNSIASDYIIEPDVANYRSSLRMVDLVPIPREHSSSPLLSPQPLLLPLNLLPTYALTITSGHAVTLKHMLAYLSESPLTFNSNIVAYGMQSGYPSIVKVLLEFGIDVDGFAALPYPFANANINSNDAKQTHLHRASHTGDIECIKLLLKYGANPNSSSNSNNLGLTPLHLACSTLTTTNYTRTHRCKHPALLLLNSGAKANAVDFKGFTPLHLACYGGDLTAIKWLVLSGASVVVESYADFKVPYEMAMIGCDENQRVLVLETLRKCLIENQRGFEYEEMFVKAKAKEVFRNTCDAFKTRCVECGRRLRTCNHNRKTNYAYFKMTHYDIPNDCTISQKSIKSVSLQTPIPTGFVTLHERRDNNETRTNDGSEVDVATQLLSRTLPINARVGESAPYSHGDIVRCFDEVLGNVKSGFVLEGEKNEVKIVKRLAGGVGGSGVGSSGNNEAKMKVKVWERLTFAERKVRLREMRG